MDYSDSVLDDEFIKILNEQIELIKSQYSKDYVKKTKLNEVIKMGTYISNLKPKSTNRDYKRFLVNYLAELKSTTEPKDDQFIWLTINKYLNPVISYLNAEHNFYIKGSLIFIGIIIGIGIDISLSIIGIAKYYYFVPVFTIIYSTIKIRKYFRLKKQGKILNL